MTTIKDVGIGRSRLRTSIYTFLLCVLVGPPVGAVFILIMGIISFVAGPLFGFEVNQIQGMTTVEHAGMSLITILVVGLVGIPFSYIYGGIPAAIGGLMMGLYAYVWGRPPFWVPIAILAIPFLIPFLSVAISGKAVPRSIVVLGFANMGLVIAGLVSWWVVVTQLFARKA